MTDMLCVAHGLISALALCEKRRRNADGDTPRDIPAIMRAPWTLDELAWLYNELGRLDI